jgi:RNA polymerase sigma-70 factor (ECF subfamily)
MLYSHSVDESDEQLMVGYVGGDITSFETLYERHRAPLYRYVLRQTGNHQATAEEIFQEVWSSVITSRNRYQASAKFSTYLYTIAHNRVIDHFRRNAVRLVDSEDCETDEFSGNTVDPAKQHFVDKCIELLQKLLQTLPADQRNVFVLRQESFHSIEEIAEITASTHEATKSRLRYAVKKLRAPLEEEDCL